MGLALALALLLLLLVALAVGADIRVSPSTRGVVCVHSCTGQANTSYTPCSIGFWRSVGAMGAIPLVHRVLSLCHVLASHVVRLLRRLLSWMECAVYRSPRHFAVWPGVRLYRMRCAKRPAGIFAASPGQPWDLESLCQ